MPEFIIEPVHGRIALSTSPKVACVTLRMWLWELAHGSAFRGGCIFRAFNPYTIRMGQQLPDTVELTAAIHRDGVSRLRAVYDHRIRQEKEAPDQGLDHFARHLPEYCKMYPQIGHHCRAQSDTLGSDHLAFSDIIPLQHLDLLKKITSEVTGRPCPPLPHIHRTHDKSPLTDEASSWFKAWTAHDTALGWDGETLRIFDADPTPAETE
jgi:hypothetical protein